MVGNIRKHEAGLYVSCAIKNVEVLVNLPNVAVVHLIDFPVFVVSVYRPPSSSSAENATLQDFLKTFSIGRELIVLGEFNLPAIDWPVGSGLESYTSPLDRDFQ